MAARQFVKGIAAGVAVLAVALPLLSAVLRPSPTPLPAATLAEVVPVVPAAPATPEVSPPVILLPAAPSPGAAPAEALHLPLPEVPVGPARLASGDLALPASEIAPAAVEPPPAPGTGPVVTAEARDSAPPVSVTDDALPARAEATPPDPPLARTAAMPGTPVRPLARSGGRIGSDEGDEVAPPVEAEPDVSADAPALARYARPFTPTGRPLMALIFLDADALEADDLPLAFAVDPTAPDATAEARRIRAAGQEVLALAVLPEGARAPDVAAAVGDGLALVPEAVALLAAGAGARRPAGQASGQIAASLLPGGEGLVTGEAGFDPVRRAGERAGVPTAQAYRTLGAGEDEGAIRRRLDQAAFHAGQTGSAILLVEGGATVLPALRAWLATMRGGAVTLAPVSAILRAAD